MDPNNQNYFINNPVFVKYKRKFDLGQLRKKDYLKSVFINERIIEIPFALKCVIENLKPTERILDLGSMESVFPLYTAALGYQITAFDFREYPYRTPNLNFVQGDILKLPFEDNEFHAVTCISTLEHIGLGFYEDPEAEESADKQAIKEVQRVLKPKGLFVLTVPFGQWKVNEQQRTYDSKTLQNLTKDFKIQEMKFFKNVPEQANLNNYWEEVSEKDASVIDSDAKTDCCCLIKASK